MLNIDKRSPALLYDSSRAALLFPSSGTRGPLQDQEIQGVLS